MQDDIKTLSDKVGEAKAKGAEKEEKPQDAVGEEEGPPAAQDCQLQPLQPKMNQLNSHSHSHEESCAMM